MIGVECSMVLVSRALLLELLVTAMMHACMSLPPHALELWRDRGCCQSAVHK